MTGARAATCLHSRGRGRVPEALARGRELPRSLCWPPGFLLGWALRPEKLERFWGLITVTWYSPMAFRVIFFNVSHRRKLLTYRVYLSYLSIIFRESLAVQWLGLHASTAGGTVQSLVWELRSRKRLSTGTPPPNTHTHTHNYLLSYSFILSSFMYIRSCFSGFFNGGTAMEKFLKGGN